MPHPQALGHCSVEAVREETHGGFQSDDQASLTLTTSEEVSYPVAKNILESTHPRSHFKIPKLGSLLPVLTKGGSPGEEAGVDSWERNSEVDHKASLGIPNPPGRFQRRQTRSGRGVEAWGVDVAILTGKEWGSSVTKGTSLVRIHSSLHLPYRPVLCLPMLSRPACVVGKGVWVRLELPLASYK